MIDLKNLSTGYGTHVVARGLTASLQTGELVCLLGANGAGKSTLLRTLCGFQPPLDGHVHIDGHPLQNLKPNQLSRLLSVVLTERPDVGAMTVLQLVAMGRSPYTDFWGRLLPADVEAAQKAMALVGIAKMQHRLVNTLSDGERQKTMIAKALAQETPIILLDEPTAFLDFPSKIEVMRLLRNLAHNHNKLVFLSTHDVELALKLADCLWLLDRDNLICGTPQQLAEAGHIQRFFCPPNVTYSQGAFHIEQST